MTKLLIVLAIVVILAVILEIYLDSRKKEWGYKYNRRQFFMTRAEHEFFDVLLQAVGAKYHVFAQVHLATLLDHRIKGQSWIGAFRHINQKSVDFVLCDKEYISPKLIIELDDRSHEREDRIERDHEVERILRDAGFPLLRIENQNNYNSTELVEKINGLIK